MPNWHTGELRLLRDLYASEPWAVMCEMLPQHSLAAIRTRALEEGVTRRSAQDIARRWMRIAHEHFARREAGAWH